MKRLALLFGVLALLVAVPFLLFGDFFDALMSGAAAQQLLESLGMWAGPAAVALLAVDLLLPIPASAIMAALGMLYGPLVGGVLAAAGSFAAGCLGYGLCRLFGRPAASCLLGAKELPAAERRFDRIGAWLIVLSRALPLLPEVLVCMAGLVRMPAARFLMALACGSVPVGFVFAGLGAAGADRPVLALAAATLLPALLWLLFGQRLYRSGAADPALAE
jgi:uncharacterized membrane protein YdjX (TVP38/TMEM64 family)